MLPKKRAGLRKGISPVEAAKLLGLSQREVYQALQKGQLAASQISGRSAITPGSLMDYRARKLFRF